MRKIGIVHSERKPTWTSCISILSGLSQAYANHFKNDEIFYYDLHLRSPIGHIVDVAKKIIADRLDRLIFINHAPNPGALLLQLARLQDGQNLPPLYFHVYGDFTFQAREWFYINSLLKGNAASIICASHAQQRLIENFIISDNDYTDYCPFPVNQNTFSHAQSLRLPARKKYHLKDDEFVFLYTGRLSLQKNIVDLCKCFIEASRQSTTKMKLLLAGAFDNIGMPFLKIEYPEGYYFHLYNSFIKDLPTAEQENIVFLGQIEQSELATLYHAADCFVSLSLYHDEDYGMSPIEALCCGTPAILTDWGGYSSFYDGGQFCDLVDVSIEENGLIIDKKAFVGQMQQKAQQQLTSADKDTCSQYFCDKFSLQGMSQHLSAIHSKKQVPFPGFNWKLKEVSHFIYDKPTRHSFYDEIYSKYISNTKKSSSHDPH